MGDKIQSYDIGGRKYKVAIMEDEKLEGDPKYPCIDYARGEYAKCVENEMVGKVFRFLNCTPPWMTDNQDFWCKGKIQFASEMSKEFYQSLIADIISSDADYGKCLEPCKVKKYLPKEFEYVDIKNFKGITLRFSKEIDVTKSSWQIANWWHNFDFKDWWIHWNK